MVAGAFELADAVEGGFVHEVLEITGGACDAARQLPVLMHELKQVTVMHHDSTILEQYSMRLMIMSLSDGLVKEGCRVRGASL